MSVDYDFYDLKHLGFDCHISEQHGYRLSGFMETWHFKDMDAVDEFVRDCVPEEDYKAFVEKYVEK